MISIIPRPKSIKVFDGNIENANNEIEKIIVKEIPAEGYKLIIDKNGVHVSASTDAGFFYAHQTMRQIIFQFGNKLPFVEIEDEPRFSHRGFMVDGVRHFVRVEHIKKIIDVASSLKMNKFHFHLSDDQGFAFEVPTLEKLVKVGSIRNGSYFGHIEKDNNIYCAYYTHAELQDLVEYSKKRHVEIIPEIDVPGHTSAFLAAYPEFSCRGEKVEVKNTAGIYKDILCAGNDEAIGAVYKILDEIVKIFDTSYIHLGGDECPVERWKECSKCQERMKKLGYTDEKQLEGFLLNIFNEYINAKGRKAIAWNESLDGGNLDNDITVQLWMDKRKKVPGWVKEGNKIINSEFFYYYMDYPWGFTPLRKTYNHNPAKKYGEDAILGIEAPIWTEHVKDFSRMCYLIFPRLVAVAETGWTQQERKNYGNFEKRLKILIPYIFKSVTYAPAKDWNMNPFRRLVDIYKFFHKTLTSTVVDGFLKN